MILSSLNHFSSIQRYFYIFLQDLFVGVVFPGNVSLGMQELASSPKLAVTKFMEGFAHFGLEISWNVLFSLQFVVSVCKRTLVSELAGSCVFPVSTHFSLELHLVLLHELLPLLLAVKLLFGLLEKRILFIQVLGRGPALFGASLVLLVRFCFFSDEILTPLLGCWELGEEFLLLSFLGLGIVVL